MAHRVSQKAVKLALAEFENGGKRCLRKTARKFGLCHVTLIRYLRKKTEEDSGIIPNKQEADQPKKPRIRNVLNLEQQVQAIREYEHIRVYHKVAKIMNCHKVQIAKIIRNKEAILLKYARETGQKYTPLNNMNEFAMNQNDSLNNTDCFDDTDHDKRTTNFQCANSGILGHAYNYIIKEIPSTDANSMMDNSVVNESSNCNEKQIGQEKQENSVQNQYPRFKDEAPSFVFIKEEIPLMIDHSMLDDCALNTNFSEVKDSSHNASQSTDTMRKEEFYSHTSQLVQNTAKSLPVLTVFGSETKKAHTRNPLNLEQRVLAIEEYYRTRSYARVAKKMNCKKSQIGNIIRNRESILLEHAHKMGHAPVKGFMPHNSADEVAKLGFSLDSTNVSSSQSSVRSASSKEKTPSIYGGSMSIDSAAKENSSLLKNTSQIEPELTPPSKTVVIPKNASNVQKIEKMEFIKTHEEAINCLKMLEDFALQEENIRLIGLVERLEAALERKR